jgi:hypothetical protein
MHINNLYKDQRILMFRQCYALEKVHGTSAHVTYRDGSPLIFFSGGEAHERFVALFNQDELSTRLAAMGHPDVTIYGEAYGGRQQGMRATYGDSLMFIAFDVKVGEHWLSVPDMAQVAAGLGLDVVPYVMVATDLDVLNRIRDEPSIVAARRGCGNDKRREGVVLRPPIEVTSNNGARVIAKHKCEEFSERATPQKVLDPDKLKVLTDADEIAREWVTLMRLSHVLDKLGDVYDMTATPRVIAAMTEDIYREAVGEITVNKETSTAIGRRTASLLKERLQSAIQDRDA